jgi:TolB-like protein/exonuclease VII small subunit
MSLFSELKRRNVFRVAVAYLAASWLLVEVTDTVFPYFNLGESAVRILIIVLAIGFPLFLIFSWVFEITPEGLKLEKDIDRTTPIARESSKSFDRVIIVLLVLAVGYFAFDKFVLDPARDAELVEETAQQARSEALVESYGEKSIAVLPFVNLSADPEQEYFSDGVSEEILNLLAQIPELRVISRSSVFYYKGKEVKLDDVARELNVAHVLEGSVRKAGDRVRITAQLIEARSDTHLWSQTYDRTLDDIFAVQDEIAAAIGAALEMELALEDGEAVQPTAIKANNSAAYDAYLRGRELIHNRNRESLETAIQHFERSLRLDDSFAPAHAQLAIVTMLLTGFTMSDREEAVRKAVRHLDRAQALEPELAEAHAGRALIAVYAEEPEVIVEHARKALAANPNYIDAMIWLNIGLGGLGRMDEARAVLERFRVTDPLSVRARLLSIRQASSLEEARVLADQLTEQNPSVGYEAHAGISWRDGRLAETLYWALRASHSHSHVMEVFMLVREYDEARRFGGRWDWWIDIAEGRWDEAIQRARKLVQLYPGSVELAYAAEILYRAGRLDEALPLYERAFELAPEGQPIPAWSRHYTMQLALTRRKTGNAEGARAAAETVRRYLAYEGPGYPEHMVEAMVASFDAEPDRATEALESAVRQSGLRWWPILDDPIFEGLSENPRFIALRQELDALIAEEHENVLQLICFNNPVPDDWQPMPETCEGVERDEDDVGSE